MPKKLDILHYAFITLLLGTLGFIFFQKNEPLQMIHPPNNYNFLFAKYKADSLLIAEQYDKAISEFEQIDSIYPYRINLLVVKALINKKREEHQTFLSFQKIDNNPESTTTQMSNKAPIARNQMNTRPKKQSAPKETKSDQHEIDEIFNGVLHLINYDGAEIDYIGEVKNGKANGYGFAVFEKKGFYEGEWANNMRNGKGIYYWQNGDVYDGNYLNGKRSGNGTYTFATGDKYKGNWNANLRHGEGILYNKKGKIISNGPWVQDEPVMTKRSKKKKK